MILAVLTLQAALILGVGLASADAILHWFNIPPSLLVEARRLWLTVLVLYTAGFPLRLLPAILGAQNRYDCYLLATAFGAIIWLAVFYTCLHLGFGSQAYAFALGVQMVANFILTGASVAYGPNRFRISLQNIPWHHARELFGFSSAVFLCGIAIQVAFMSQSLIITKILGLGAVAGFTVCSKVPMQLMQLIWRPFDAFSARWQIFWAKAETGILGVEFVRMLRVTIGLAMLTATFSLAMNRWFVFVFGKQSLYQGKAFDFFFTLFIVAQVWAHCLSLCFILAKRMKGYALIVILDTAVGIIVAILGTKFFGLVGYIAFTALYGLVGLGFWYITLTGPRCFGLGAARLLRESATPFCLFVLLLLASLPAFDEAAKLGQGALLGTEIGLVIVGIGLFVGLFRRDLRDVINYLRQALAKRRAQQPELAPLL